MCLTRPSKDIPGIPAARPSKGIPDIPVLPDIPVFPDIPVVPDIPVISDIPVIQDLPAYPGNSTSSSLSRQFYKFQPLQAILQVPVTPGNPPHSSILRLECIFYIFYKFYSSIGFHRKLHQVPVGQYKLQTLHSSKKGRCCDIGQFDIFSRIELRVKVTLELIPSIVLSSK